MTPQGQRPEQGGFLIVLLLMLFVVVMFRLLTPTPHPAVDAKPFKEEVNTVDNSKVPVYNVAQGIMNTFLYKVEVGNDVIYFSSKGGVWGHPKP